MVRNKGNGVKEDASLKVLVIASTYPRDDADHSVPWMRESHAQLANRGHKLTVLAPSYKGLKDHVVDGIPVKRFRYAPKKWERLTHEQGAPNKVHNPLVRLLTVPYLIAGYFAAVRLAKRERFDVVHVHWPFPHELMGTAAARICGAPLVLMSHGAEFALGRRWRWVNSSLRRSLQKGKLLLANSNDTASQIKKLCGRDAIVLPYGTTVHPKSVSPPKNERPRLLFTGRLIQRKGVEYLLRAMPRILAHIPVDLVITGDGDQREKLEGISRQLGLEQFVHFLGFVSNEQLNEEYSRCDVWVNPSVIDDNGDTEGLGVGSIEAYAHRKPVVVSSVGGIPDTVEHGRTGYLVPEKSPRELANAILDLIVHPAKARSFGEAGLKFAKEKFDWHGLTCQLEDAYRSLLRPASITRKKPMIGRSNLLFNSRFPDLRDRKSQ